MYIAQKSASFAPRFHRSFSAGSHHSLRRLGRVWSLCRKNEKRYLSSLINQMYLRIPTTQLHAGLAAHHSHSVTLQSPCDMSHTYWEICFSELLSSCVSSCFRRTSSLTLTSRSLSSSLFTLSKKPGTEVSSPSMVAKLGPRIFATGSLFSRTKKKKDEDVRKIIYAMRYIKLVYIKCGLTLPSRQARSSFNFLSFAIRTILVSWLKVNTQRVEEDRWSKGRPSLLVSPDLTVCPLQNTTHSCKAIKHNVTAHFTYLFSEINVKFMITMIDTHESRMYGSQALISNVFIRKKERPGIGSHNIRHTYTQL